MTLTKLSKEVQELLREGIAIIYVWKIGKSWKYSAFWYENINNQAFSLEDQMNIDSIMEADKAATSFNGYEEFASYTLSYIQDRIKYGYLRSQQDIRENEIEKRFAEIEKDQKEEKTNFKFSKTLQEQNLGDKDYRLIDITIQNIDLESYRELIDDLLYMLSLKKIHAYKSSLMEAGKEDNTCKMTISVDENRLREFAEVFQNWVNYWTETKEILQKAIVKEDKQTFLESEIEFWNDDSNKSLNDEIKEEVKEKNKNEGILYNTSTEINKNIAKYKVGQILYNHGDMANVSGWYRISDIIIDKFGIYYIVEEIGGDRENSYHECFINDHDNNNGSTRVVTKEAREKIIGADYVKRQLDSLFAKIDPIKKEDVNIKNTLLIPVNRDKEAITTISINEKTNQRNNLVEDILKKCHYGIVTEMKISSYFDKLNNKKRAEMINKFQDNKDININLFYYTVFSPMKEYKDIHILEMLKSKIDKYVDIICDFKNLLIEEVNKSNEKEEEKKYKYTYKSRGFSPDCQPMNGLVKSYKNDLYPFEILIYNRQLSQNEIEEFELKELFSNC